MAESAALTEAIEEKTVATGNHTATVVKVASAAASEVAESAAKVAKDAPSEANVSASHTVTEERVASVALLEETVSVSLLAIVMKVANANPTVIAKKAESAALTLSVVK